MGRAPQMHRAPLPSEVQSGLSSICPASVSDRKYRREPALLSPCEPNSVPTCLRRTHLIRSTARSVTTFAYWSRHTPSSLIPHPWKRYLRTSIYPSIPQLWPKNSNWPILTVFFLSSDCNKGDMITHWR